jgi:hypothetical protein
LISAWSNEHFGSTPLLTDTVLALSRITDKGLRGDRRRYYLRARGGIVIATIRKKRLDALTPVAWLVCKTALSPHPFSWLQTSRI